MSTTYGRAAFVTLAALLAAMRPPAPASADEPAGRLDAAALASLIDRELAQRWKAEGIVPAPLADDAEFLRRVSLDVIGKIPSIFEVREFLADRAPDKRRRKVEQLLGRGSYATHFANAWRDLALPGANSNLETRGLAPSFEAWLKVRFSAGTPYDRLVTELLTPVAMAETDLNPFTRRPTGPSPLAFYQFNERKPESLAASTARIFLGTQVQCAQCHDHPFAHWKRQEFWALAAFFAGVAPAETTADPDETSKDKTESPAAQPAGSQLAGLSIKVPDSDMVVDAKFLDGSSPTWRPGEDPRLKLTRWITRPDNPYFARAAVNRLWEHFFGHGLVDPVDDLDEKNAPSDPELFAELARQFVDHQYDFKYVIRAITSSQAYQLTSRTDAPTSTGSLTSAGSPASTGSGNSANPQSFARMPLRRMTAEQLYDSLLEATGFHDVTPRQQVAVFGVETGRAAFQAKFADQSSRRSEAQTSILQALALMNGTFVSNATSLERSVTLAAVAEVPKSILDTPARIEALFMASLNRPPDLAEAEQFAAYVQQAGPGDEKAALADVFWALLNSAEFIMNH